MHTYDIQNSRFVSHARGACDWERALFAFLPEGADPGGWTFVQLGMMLVLPDGLIAFQEFQKLGPGLAAFGLHIGFSRASGRIPFA